MFDSRFRLLLILSLSPFLADSESNNLQFPHPIERKRSHFLSSFPSCINTLDSQIKKDSRNWHFLPESLLLCQPLLANCSESGDLIKVKPFEGDEEEFGWKKIVDERRDHGRRWRCRWEKKRKKDGIYQVLRIIRKLGWGEFSLVLKELTSDWLDIETNCKSLSPSKSTYRSQLFQTFLLRRWFNNWVQPYC